MTHQELKNKALARQNVRAEYDALEFEFALLKQSLTPPIHQPNQRKKTITFQSKRPLTSENYKMFKTKPLALLTLALLPSFFTPANADLKEGLVAHWSFDDCTAKDNSGNGHDGTLNGNPQCVDGVKEKAFSFDGSNTSITSFLPKIKKTYSVSVFAKFNSNDKVENQIFYLTRSEQTTDRLGYLSTFPVGNKSWHFGAAYITGNWGSQFIGQENIKIDSQNLPNNVWYHLTFILNDTSIALYVDGLLFQSIEYKTHPDIENNPTLFFILGATTEGYQHMDGLLDELRIYNRTLSETEVKSLYAGVSGISGNINGVQKYSAVCKNTKTSVTKKIAMADGAKEWNCKTAGLQTKKGDIVTVTITGVSQ
jgi:hypothetical protein